MSNFLRSASFGWCVLCSLGVGMGYARGQPSATAGKVPPPVASLGELGENIYDFAKADDWAKAPDRLTALADAVKHLPKADAGGRADRERLNQRITALGKAVAAKDRQAAMREANQITALAADLAAPFHPKVPVDVTRLDYYGRELEVWAGANDRDKLKATADALRKTWDRVRPEVVKAKGGAAEAKKFDELVGRVEAAKTSAEYARLATPVLDAVDKLEGVFPK